MLLERGLGKAKEQQREAFGIKGRRVICPECFWPRHHKWAKENREALSGRDPPPDLPTPPPPKQVWE